MKLMGGLLLVLILTGCTSRPALRLTADDTLFGPANMRIHPSFTQIKDWTGDNRPDGVEALVQFTDRFDDPTKAAGRVMFELFDYRPTSPDVRGKRLADPWFGPIATLDEQRQHWEKTSGTYSFRLPDDAIRADRTYVLAATFDRADGGRFFDQLVLVGKGEETKHVEPGKLPGTRPAMDRSSPGSRTPQP